MGPLQGIKVIEIAGIGPAPIAGMMLADLGAEVILVERVAGEGHRASPAEFFRRGKKSLALDLKAPDAAEMILSLLEESDVLIEGFRPGVMERLGLGPDVCLTRNKRLIYGRMTGWGQDGPLSQAAGHDLNYQAVTGAVHYSGFSGDRPYPTSTLVGDVAGGSMPLVLGIVSALYHVQRTGEGQVIDAAICDGTIYNLTLLAGLKAAGAIGEERGNDPFTGAAHWANTYSCADGRYITVQALEPKFYQQLVSLCGFDEDPDFAEQYNQQLWPLATEKMNALFASQSQDHWCSIFEGTDACFAPVLSLSEAAQHSHNKARNNFIEDEGILCPAPAPKFSITHQQPGEIVQPGQHTEEIVNRLKCKESTAV
ncbi:CaiB/BaiF CoA-transferase family protein [Maricurvus nonylphenolicus]|uniref:CaiB/BaiF CoA transferase family protein n=1 Tax=Maricurvus nonylphenolicus TaxID=1008307 RepID=UPI0036F3C6D3